MFGKNKPQMNDGPVLPPPPPPPEDHSSRKIDLLLGEFIVGFLIVTMIVCGVLALVLR